MSEEKKRKGENSDVSSVPSLSTATQPSNNGSGKSAGIEIYKRTKHKNLVMILDDTCVMTQLRTSFIQDYLGALKSKNRKFISIRNV